jgi:hypothetical protein
VALERAALSCGEAVEWRTDVPGKRRRE